VLTTLQERSGASTSGGRCNEADPRPLRPICLVAGGWLGLFLVVNLVILLSGVAAPWAGKDPRVHGDGWPGITNLRVVDDRLLIGGETSPEQYRELAERDVTLVIDTRTGGGADASTDDPQQLVALGMDYTPLPTPDGRAPTPAQIRRLLDLVATADGRVFWLTSDDPRVNVEIALRAATTALPIAAADFLLRSSSTCSPVAATVAAPLHSRLVARTNVSGRGDGAC